MAESDLTRRLDRYLAAESVWPGPQRLRQELRLHLGGTSPRGKNVLEIGAGSGITALYCAALGASRVVALEPESAGSTAGVARAFARHARETDLEQRVDYRTVAFEEYAEESAAQTFDLVLMRSVVNHLDEQAVRRLHCREAHEERRRYLDLFSRAFRLTAPGGVLIASDVARSNFWNVVGLRSPFAPTVEWDKHQQPGVWQSLLAQVGYKPLDCRWIAPYRLRRLRLGWLLDRGAAAWFMDSFFVLRLERAGVTRD